MDFFFVDDAQQNKPSRQGMGPIIAAGGIHVPDESIQELESKLDALCLGYGFPPNEIFKWSPGKELWMYKNLKGKAREKFFIEVLDLAQNHDTIAVVVMEDINSGMATSAKSRDIDLIQLLLERIHHQFAGRRCKGVVIVAQPSGDRRMENKFISDCIETMKCGTDYLKPDRIALSVLSSPPRFIRLLQLADIITSCSTAFVAGERRFSPPIFELIKPIFARDLDRVGGVGLKIHPDLKYANLYHWLLGDTTFWKRGSGISLPRRNQQYNTSPDIP